MVEGLKGRVAQAEDFMHRVVEEAADAGGAQADGLGFEIENLCDRAGFPVKAAVKPIAELAQRIGEFSDKTQ